MSGNGQLAGAVSSDFHPIPLLLIVLAFLLGISLWANWYSGAVSLPRYCENPAKTLDLLQRIITEDRPAGDEARKPYLITAKLLFLLPQKNGEDTAAYLNRVKAHVETRCIK